MPIELRIAALGALLLFVHIFAAIRAKTAQYGRAWNTSARDEPLPPPNPMVGRLTRAQANFAETFPIAVVALLGVVMAERTNQWTALGGWIWLGARLVPGCLPGPWSPASLHGRQRRAVALGTVVRHPGGQSPGRNLLARSGA